MASSNVGLSNYLKFPQPHQSEITRDTFGKFSIGQLQLIAFSFMLDSISVEQTNNVEIPPPDKQKEEILTNFNTKLVNGNEWFLISSKWFQQWKDYVGFETENPSGPMPGPIPNDTLISFTTANQVAIINSDLKEEQDFVLVPSKVGKFLHQWYNGVQISRRVIGKDNNEVVELHPIVCGLAVYKEAKIPLEFQNFAFSKEETIFHVLGVVKIITNKEMAEGRVWTAILGSPYQHISEETRELGSFMSQKKLYFCVEFKEHFEWPLSFKHNARASSYESTSTYRSTSSSNSYYSSYTSQTTEPGLSGLMNLGNTCFMNSALQCLTKTPYIQDYFMKRDWKTEINSDNPLGMGGKIATVFGDLMNEMWKEKKSNIVPRDFKQVIGDFQPQFSGYSQQDSQELISYLLDGLHEDLNRIVKKPSTTKPEGTIGQDEQLATDTWNVHLKRNNSFVTDHFQGLLKSTLICPDCQNVAVTFDPYMYLPLPLPVQKNRILTLTIVWLNNTIPPTELSLLVNKNGSLKELRHQIAEFAKCEAKNVVLADIFNYKVYKYLSDTLSISQISERDKTFAYVLQDIPYVHSEIYHWDTSKETSCPFVFVRYFKLERAQYSSQTKLTAFGTPFTLAWNSTKTCKQLYLECLDFVKRYIKLEQLTLEGFDINNPETLFPRKDVSTEKPYLFSLQWENVGSSDEYGAEMQFCDDIVPPKETISNEKKGLALAIHPWVLENLINVSELEKITLDESREKLKVAEEKGVSLDDCIKLFISQETLGAEDAWYCPKCTKFVQATKKLDIWKLSDVLVINLKRFQFTKYHRDKIESMVTCPLVDLDLSEYCENANAKYNLFAVSNHYGGLSGGHYTAYAKVGDKWYDFNDSSVSETSERSVVSSAAYVLFYVRNDKEAITEAKGKIFPSKEQIEEEERQKKEAEERKRVREEEARKKKEEEAIKTDPEPMMMDVPSLMETKFVLVGNDTATATDAMDTQPMEESQQ
jgi:ubiquitin C-terminal hydrolase